jgi:hypothetical protein
MPSAPSIPPPAATAAVLLRERVKDPDRWIEAGSWALVAFCCIQILLFSFGRDQSIYAVVGDGVLHGKMPYRDLWDFKPPGIFLVYALAQSLFGKNMLAPRLLEVAGLCGMVFAFRKLGERLLEQPRAGLVGGALAALVLTELEFWHSGQPETFGGFAIAYALVITTGDHGKRRHLGWVAVGLLFGAAFVLKPPLAGGALVCAAYLARQRWHATGRVRDAAVPVLAVGLSSLVPIVACALWFWAKGAWPALAWTEFQFTPGYSSIGWTSSATSAYYQGLEETLTRFSALNLFGFIAAITMLPLHSREREAVWLVIGVVAVNVAGIAMQHKYFQYHYGATLPLMAFVAGIGLYKIWRRCLAGGAGGMVAFLSFCVIAVSMRESTRDLTPGFWQRSAMRMHYLLHTGRIATREDLDRELYAVSDYSLDADRQVAEAITRRTADGAPVFVWGFEPAIYWLSGRTPASRYIYDVAQRAQWERGRARQELMEDLRRTPPEVIVVQRNDSFYMVTGDSLDSAAALWQFPELARLVEQEYRFVSEVADFDLYERVR